MESALMKHPCYNEEAHHHFARMHIAVAPKCNIRCNYCNPKFDCVNESRPGVTSNVLTPEEAFNRVSCTLTQLPSLTVVGIAGPGDPLANADLTFRAFRFIAKAYPELHLCLSTNGLMLPEYVDEIKDLGIRHVTVTLNAVEPDIGKDIYDSVFYQDKIFRGKEAAALLIERQLSGIKRLAEAGVLCKVNSVHIPEINGTHLEEVSRRIKELGAFSHNIMPLILSPGSKFQKEGYCVPTAEESLRAQRHSARMMPVMKHCRQCRADAVGLLGADVSQNPEMLSTGTHFTKEDREVYQKRIISRMPTKQAECNEEWEGSVRAAVATRGSGLINQHFGHAKEFLVYEVHNDSIRLLGVRKVQAYCNGKANCSTPKERHPLSETLEMLQDCKLLLCSGIGSAPSQKLQIAGIIPLIRKGEIKEQLLESVRYYNMICN